MLESRVVTEEREVERKVRCPVLAAFYVRRPLMALEAYARHSMQASSMNLLVTDIPHLETTIREEGHSLSLHDATTV